MHVAQEMYVLYVTSINTYRKINALIAHSSALVATRPQIALNVRITFFLKQTIAKFAQAIAWHAHHIAYVLLVIINIFYQKVNA